MKKLNRIFLSVLIALCLGTLPTMGQLTLNVAADGQIQGDISGASTNGMLNVGLRNNMAVRNAGFAGGNYTSYLRFNLAGLTTTIDMINLRLILNAATTTTQEVKVYVLNDAYAGGVDEGGEAEMGENWTEGNRDWAVALAGQINGDRAPAFNELNGTVVTTKATLIGTITLAASAAGKIVYFSSQALMDAINNDTDNNLTIILAGGAGCNLVFKTKEALTTNIPMLEYTYVGAKTAVTGVSVAPTTLQMSIASKKQLTATVTPADASNKKVTWSTSNSAIATVDETGIVSAIEIGTADIIATSVDGSFTAKSTITSGLYPRDSEYLGANNAPAGVDLYAPKPALSGNHPRLFFTASSLSSMKEKVANPAYEAIWGKIKTDATSYANITPPAVFGATTEDPWRQYAEYLGIMSIAYILDNDAARKTVYMNGIDKWVNAWYGYGLSTQDLATSHILMNLSYTYDWLFNDLSSVTRNKLRLLIVNHTRWLRSPNNTGVLIGANQWRNREFGTNHNWYNHTAAALAAVALWGESGEVNGCEADEPQNWLTSAVRNYWEVMPRQCSDGALMEGYNYIDYGMVPMLDFGTLLEQLTTTTSSMPSILDNPGIKNLGKVRARMLLPNAFGFKSWSDSGWKIFNSSKTSNSSWIFRLLASRFNDSESQTIATIIDTKGLSPDWRSLFYYNASVVETPLADIPKVMDCNDLNLFSARNAWSGDKQNFFSFKCGQAAGKTVNKRYPNECTGHNQTDPNSFEFWWNENPIVTGPGYQKKKLTSHYSVTKINKASDKVEVQQLGAGGDWFQATGATGYWSRPDSAVTLEVKHSQDFHTYLGESGGLYVIGSAKCNYRRRAVYFPSGAVVIADRISTPVATNLAFRFVTSCPDLSVKDNVYSFTSGGTKGTITNYSPATDSTTITTETIATWSTEVPVERKVANIKKMNVTQAYFGAVINMGAENAVSITNIDVNGITVKYNNGAEYFFAWDATGDDIAPSVPTNLIVVNTGYATADLAWDASTDNVKVSGYKIYKNNVYEKTVGTNSTQITGLSPQSDYDFMVSAIDNNNESGKSNVLTIFTKPAVTDDNVPPSTPQNLAISSITPSKCELAWQISTDNQVVVGYNIYVDGVFNKFVVANSGTIEGLNPANQYHFSVKAKDYNGNLSAESNIVTGITASLTPDPWLFTPIPAQTGTFTAEVDVRPRSTNMNGILAFSNSNVAGYSNMAVIARFAPNGGIDARNAGVYVAANVLNFVPFTKYHLRYSINVASRTCNIWATPEGGTEVQIANNYAFRTEQNATSSLNYFLSQTEAGNMDVMNLTINGTQIFSAVPALTFESNKLKVYPNPANGNAMMTIKYEDNKPWNVEIYNMQGQLKFKRTDLTDETHVSTSILSKGIYIVKAGLSTQKLVIK